ncbi:hypothetical protein KVR01_005338 [Diaporthe batatas]|uniref:uncharacterized protein n=1 Tax=Diaporthe batatas TaxID=748121 RepID=UPI001D044047|nr:uncharacterized protein KVR01_005338 [Diaporthe batatas]KAG8165063.1 hypothetical protein KVR01_005338 [Diaporthe batatas]
MRSEEPPQYDPVPSRHQRWTYGYRLIDDSAEAQDYRNTFTPLLCETIARCLMHKQEHRPDLVQLQRIITNALGNLPPRLPVNVVRFFGSDAPPPVPIYAPFSDLGTIDPFDPYPGLRYLDDIEPWEAPDSPPRKRVRLSRADRSYRP